MELADDALSLAEILRANGYATHAVGKWHLARDTNLAPGRTRDSWPLQRGFDSYYGSLEGLNSFYYPNELISDNSVVDVEEYPSDYYVTDDITDKAVSRIKSLRAHDADKPFFLYFSHIGMHGPHQAKPEDLAKYRGRYTEGWDAVRRSRFDAQLEAGFFPPGTQMAERNTEPGYDAPPWDELTEEEQLRFARYQEVYAAMVDSIDQSVGRVLDTLDELGETDNTIIVFTSDNGGTAEGGAAGTRSYFSQFVHGPVPSDWVRDVPHDEELIGSEKIGVHYPRGWGQASNTPFRFYKGQTFAGGVRVPFLLSWPAGLGRADGDTGLRKQYSYVTDITPTLLDLAGLETPSHRNGLPARSVTVSASPASYGTPRSPPRTRSSTPSSAVTAGSTGTAGNCCRCTWIRPGSTIHNGSCSTSNPTPPKPRTSRISSPRRCENSPRRGIERRGTTPCSRSSTTARPCSGDPTSVASRSR